MKKIKNTVKFGLLFKDRNHMISTAPHLNGYKDASIKLDEIKPIVFTVFKNLESEGLVFSGDKIVAINNNKIKNMYDFYIQKNKLAWNSNVYFKIFRKNKFINVKVRLKSFNNWKKRFPRIGIDIIKKSKYVEISEVQTLSSALPKWGSNTKIKTGDKLISINNRKINQLSDVSEAIGNCIPKKFMTIEALNEYGVFKTKIKVISYEDFLKLNREFCMGFWPEKAAIILCKEYEDNDFYLDEKYKSKIIEKYSGESYNKKLLKAAKIGVKKGRLKLTPKGRLKSSRKTKSVKLYT